MSEQYNASFYRNSQYDNAESAAKNGGLRQLETTYGYTSTMDGMMNMRTILDCYAHNAINEFWFIWTIDGVKFPEMTYGQSIDLLDASYDYFDNGKNLKKFLASDLQPA
jgi:hypothetical protein